jgi:hypothetical protein
MATTCPKCGTSLAAGALFCSACGQSIAAASPKPAGPPAAGAKRMPIAALVILLGGLVVLLGAFWLYQSGGFSGSGGTAGPSAATPAAAANPPDPVPSAPLAAPATAAPTAPAPAPEAPAAAMPAPAGSPGAAAKPAPAAPAAPSPAGAATVAAKPAPPPPPPFRKTYECREYATFKIDPDTAIVTVDGEVIGIADEWADTPRTKKYKFQSEGVHYVKLSHRDYETLWLRFIVSKDALDKTAIVELTLKEQK